MRDGKPIEPGANVSARGYRGWLARVVNANMPRDLFPQPESQP